MTAHSDQPAPDVLTELRARGFDAAGLTAEQRQLLRDLSLDELAVLLDVKAGLEGADDEVQAHCEVAGGALF
ncbi:aroma-sacti cluster domain-containing protein [Streptomyces sp. JJ38]|uniref:aroma-sacti cluster domain-containing protein n=1 Tax=Streptomyces sp. JJ38 TaxID=2738128 RepID=UPI001C599C15|nr:aroma-sacti cluster domain-containing protein [Streptomyces sp. JJ38]MBW1595500.1 hypothetical protein [Streptomyces sp. JJ38]